VHGAPSEDVSRSAWRLAAQARIFATSFFDWLREITAQDGHMDSNATAAPIMTSQYLGHWLG
jgi:hypothetical protein